MIVCSVGTWTYIAKMKEKLGEEEDGPTPLQCKLEKVAD